MRVEGTVKCEAVRGKERRAFGIRGGVSVVQMYSDIERIADQGALPLDGGAGRRVVQNGECEEVGAIAMLTAGGDAEFIARCGNVRVGDPGGAVGAIGEVEGIAMAAISCKMGQKREHVVMYRVFHGLGAKGRIGGPEAMS